MVRRMKRVLAALSIASTVMAAANAKQEAGLEAGRRAYEASDYAKAIQALQAAAAKDPQNGEVQLLLAKSYLELQEYDPAIKSAEKAVAIDPQNSVYHEWLGMAYGEKADHASLFSAISLAKKTRNGRIAAPADGTLYSLPVKAGDYVKLGDLLAEMADLHKIRVRAFIDEPELGALEPNEPIKITWDALPSRSWVGKTEIIPKQVVSHQNRSVGELLCAVNNDKLELLPNINVNVRINSRERIGVLSVPRGAVAAEGGRRYVFVVKRNQLSVNKSILEKREIHVGIADATNYEVVSGLQEGELVALPGDVDLRDGMTVTVITTEVFHSEERWNG